MGGTVYVAKPDLCDDVRSAQRPSGAPWEHLPKADLAAQTES